MREDAADLWWHRRMLGTRWKCVRVLAESCPLCVPISGVRRGLSSTGLEAEGEVGAAGDMGGEEDLCDLMSV